MSCLLSYVGHIQLIKTVLGAMSPYWTSTFKLAMRLFDHIFKLLSAILWKGKTECSSLHNVNWRKVNKPLNEVGIGVCDLSKLNLASLGKLFWRVLTKEFLLIKGDFGLSGTWCLHSKIFHMVCLTSLSLSCLELHCLPNR